MDNSDNILQSECSQAVYDNDWYDLILKRGDVPENFLDNVCRMSVNGSYQVWYYPRTGLPPLEFETYSYNAVPKCFAPQSVSALEESGILSVRSQPNLELTGAGVLIGIIDSGIDYMNQAFRYEDGSSRIAAIWDQTASEGEAPEGFFYGQEYTREEINTALSSENPRQLIPEYDPTGHGTSVAAVAAGSIDEQSGFSGAAPYADIAVVKLKEAKQYLREFYFIPDDAPAYQENDIMLGIEYLNRLADARDQPLVLMLALGTNNGSHGGSSFLSALLDDIGLRNRRAVVVAAGNEANARHHYYGSILSAQEQETVEINVEREMNGFFLEMWCEEPELYEVAVIAPSGERFDRVRAGRVSHFEYRFVLEGTRLSVDYRVISGRSADQLIYLRFERPSSGIWRIIVYPRDYVNGHFDMWLPVSGFLASPVYFLRSNPDTTITVPGCARLPMTVGGYNDANGALYLDSGRGYTINGAIKPDLAAPAIDIPDGSGNLLTGTSYAAAITAGAAALYLEWAIVRGNAPITNSVNVKNELLRGAYRQPGELYPNREWGYGRLDIAQTMRNLAGL